MGKRSVIIQAAFTFFFFIAYTTKVKYQESIEIPFILDTNNRIVLNAAIDGKEGQYIFDTGSAVSLADINTANLWLHGYSFRYREGKRYIQWNYLLKKIRFNDVDVNADSWITNDPFARKNLIKSDYDGLLGIMTFEGYWCELSFSKSKIILHKEKPDNFIKSVSAKVESKYRPQIDVPIEVDGNEIYLMIDTGLPFAFAFPSGLIDYKTSDKITEVSSIEEEGPLYYMIHTNSISFLDETYANNFILTRAIREKRGGKKYRNAGLVGINILKYYDLLFDLTSLRKGKTTEMYYQPNAPLEERDYGFFSFNKEPPYLGILNYNYIGKGIFILSMLKNSIGQTCFGIDPGDIITQINGTSSLTFSQNEITNSDFIRNIQEFVVLENGIERIVNIK